MVEKISNTMGFISLGFSQKKNKIKIKIVDKKIINFFYDHNFISDLRILNNFYYLKLNLNGDIKIKNWYRTNSKIYLTHNQLLKKKTNLFSTIYILSNSRGVMTQYEALKLNCGGILIGKIYLK